MSNSDNKSFYDAGYTHTYTHTEEQRAVIEEDKLNRQTPFDPRTQIYPADLFILEGFDFRHQPIWVRTPRWHDDKGYFIGRSK